MVVHFVRLKLALLRSSFSRGWQRAVGTVIGVVYATPLALAAAAGLTVLGRRVDAPVAGDALVIAFVALWGVWTVGPVLFFGLDETLDPARLRLLPLSSGQLALGLGAASAVGVAPIATLVGLLGVIGGFAPAGPLALAVLGAVVVQFALCIVSARTLVTVLSPRLSSRRGRDLLALLGGLAGLAFAGVGQLPNLLLQSGEGLGADRARELLDAVAGVAAVLPPAWAARAVTAAAASRPLEALGWLLAAAALAVLLARVWVAALERTATRPGAAAETAAADDGLYPRGFGALPRTPLGATIAKELRYLARVPAWRVALLFPAVGAVGLVVATAVLPVLDRPQAVLAPPLTVAIIALSSLNLFGADRGAVWLLVASGSDPRVDIAGKQLALALVALPLAVVTTLAVASSTGGWALVPASLVLTFVLFAVGSGVGGIASVVAPQPSPVDVSNAFAGATGTGCVTALLQLAAMTVLSVVLAPPAVLVLYAVLAAPALLAPALAAAVAWALGAWWLGLRVAAARLASRGPEFVAALTPGRS